MQRWMLTPCGLLVRSSHERYLLEPRGRADLELRCRDALELRLQCLCGTVKPCRRADALARPEQKPH
eukprot:1475570-Prymnesium_polylepis.1